MSDLDWTAVYRAHYGQVRRYLYLRTRDVHLADDLTQDVFAKAIRSAGQFADDGRGIGPWLITIARTRWFDHVKRHSTVMEQLAYDPADIVVGAPPAPSAETVALGTDAALQLRSAMDQLPAAWRESLTLQYWDGWPAADIGVHQGVAMATVLTRAHRSRLRLRKLLAGVA